jgi:hypothetical protein
MAAWLSSKLKVAESFLNQVDATAASSLTELKHELTNVPTLHSLFTPFPTPAECPKAQPPPLLQATVLVTTRPRWGVCA